jgi:hypothetical protein
MGAVLDQPAIAGPPVSPHVFIRGQQSWSAPGNPSASVNDVPYSYPHHMGVFSRPRVPCRVRPMSG